MWDLAFLFQHYGGDITRNLRRRGLSAVAAADLTQETFLRVLTLRAGAGADGQFIPDNPRGYLKRVASNLFIDLRRRERHSPFVATSADGFDAVGDQAPSQERALVDRHKLAAVAAALDMLPERTRRAFEMHRLGGRTIAEVAVELGLSTSRTGALIKEAYNHIRHHVRSELD